MKEIALEYLRKFGFNIIPVNKEKRPFIEWQKYQTERITQALIEEWWTTWPDANIGIVTGETSELIVIDADSEAGVEEIKKIAPELTATVKSPNGWHFYCNNINGTKIGNAVRFIPDCDIRGQGGYIVAPPSINSKGIKYQQLTTFSDLITIPAPLLILINAFSSSLERGVTNTESLLHSVTKRDILLQRGTRDEDLFHIANCLIKGRMDAENARQVLEILARNCNPPFSEKEVKIKVESALKRNDGIKESIASELRCYILLQKGYILVTECYNLLHCASKQEKTAVRTALTRLKDEGIIESTGRRVGEYRVISDMSPILSMTDETEIQGYAKIWLPWDLSDMVQIPHGSLIVLGGSPNAGKSTVLLNILRYNMKKWNVRYLSTEISHFEFKERAKDFKSLLPKDWSVKFQEDLTRDSLVDHIAGSDKDTLWLIDYVEVYDKFYEIGGILRDLHSRLHGGVMIAAVQKNKGADMAVGGNFTEMKPQLVVSMDWDYENNHGIAEIRKAKIIKKQHRENYGHPSGKRYLFEWKDGIEIKKKVWWTRAEAEKRGNKNG